MKTTTYLAIRRPLISAILLLLSIAVLSAQIQIKSRVDIAPRASAKVQESTTSTISPGTLLFDSYVQGYCSAMTYYFEVNGVFFGSTTPADRFSQLLLTNTAYAFGRFPAGTIIVPRISHFTSYTQGFPDADLIQEPRTTEDIAFTVTGFPNCEPEGYISLMVGNLFNHFDGTFSKSEIGAGEAATLSLEPIGNDSGSVGLIDDAPILIFADTMIQLVDPDEVGGLWKDGSSIYYYRWGKAKNGIQIIGKEIYGDGGYYYETVGFGLNRPVTSATILVQSVQLCPELKLSKDYINPGDTVAISIIGHKPDGTTVPYPADQALILQMNADKKYGRLHCISNNEEGSYVYGQQPFEFIAADSIDVDSIVINIKVTPISGGGASSIKDGQKKDTLQRQAVLEKNITPTQKGVVPIEGDTKNVLTVIQASVAKKLAEEKNALAQKAAKKQSLIKAITEAIKTQKTGKSDAASAKQLNAMIQDLAEGDQCQRYAPLTIKKPIPTDISLSLSSYQAMHGQTVTLKIVLKDKNGYEIKPNNTDATVNICVGEEAEKYGKLIEGQQQGITLTNISYADAYNGSISFTLDGDNYDGKFPIRISFSTSSGLLTSNLQILTLVGPNTVGKYFSQGIGSWASEDYDTEIDPDATEQNDSTTYYHIQAKGCAMTCVAMVLKAFGCNVDPGTLNNWMKDPNNQGFTENGDVDWKYIPLNYPGSPVGTSLPVNGMPLNLDPLNYNLNQGYPSFACLGHHWVLITGITQSGQYTILDPGSSTKVTLDPSLILKYREVIPK